MLLATFFSVTVRTGGHKLLMHTQLMTADHSDIFTITLCCTVVYSGVFNKNM